MIFVSISNGHQAAQRNKKTELSSFLIYTTVDALNPVADAFIKAKVWKKM